MLLGDVEGQQLYRDFFFKNVPSGTCTANPIPWPRCLSFQQIVYSIWDVIFVDRRGPMVGLRQFGMGQEQHKGEGDGDRSY